MTAVPDERASTLRRIREALSDLVADGVDFVPRPPRATVGTRATAPAPARPAPAFQPRVAALVEPAQTSAEAASRGQSLLAVRAELGDCRRCRLCEKRSEIVFGEGAADARVMFVGEGPGEEEDKSGRPFVGRAGELLSKIIESVGWRREDVYICNIVKCRPPGNRDPQPDEIAACLPFLIGQIRAIAPRAIVTLGKPAISTLLGRPVAITRMRGRWLEFQGTPVMPTYHPAYLLRNYTRETRQAVWDDLRAVRERVEGAGAG